ncbi:protein YgfX [Stutzerimonas nitrititolerans]|uniref:protein YgfX n=1 Tax=Stutzerimonas nitrititolerans TaxID=2482751 RepID=UPI0028B05B28|nr:protein YgfX [Stutzerimonas nitrititolerans]
MSSPSNSPFECQWQPSGLLLTFYIAAQVLALAAILTSAAPVWLQLICLLSCLAHAGYVVPRSVLLSRRGSWRGLRHDEDGWHLWNQQQGWQPIQLLPDSLALPLVVVLRFRLPGRRCADSICIPRDALPREQHRRLRVRLKFSRRRWAAPG